MKCNFCGAEMDDDAVVCPSCGTSCSGQDGDRTPEVPEKNGGKKPSNTGKIILVTVLGILLLAALTFAVLYGTGIMANKPQQTPTDATDSTVQTTVPPESQPSELGTAVREVYTVSDEQAVAAKDTVVATLGDRELTNSQLQLWYWMGVYDFLNQAGGNTAMLGLDLTKPLNQQIQNPQTGDNWEQAFLDYALGTWARFASIEQLGREQNIPISQETLDALEQMPRQMEEVAKQNNFESLEAMIQADMGPASDFAGYKAYMELSYLSMEYFDTIYGSLTADDAEVEAYFTQHEAEFAQNLITKDSGKVVDVRHILIAPKGGTQDPATSQMTYTDEEWEACRAEAQELLDRWLAEDGTEDGFAEAARKHSADPGSASKGGLYQGVSKGQMVPEFDAWIFDETRKPGDSGLVKSPFGYHLMYFVDGQDMWFRQARLMLLSEKAQTVLEDYMKAHPMHVDYDAIALGYVELMPAKPETPETTEPSTAPASEGK